ncbi:hypothetical protein G6N74_30225 [Mesorhizobium sp. CGMCC 1.15528]|uniref:Bestrophin n=1 Tax=Mesorhizobium zhangyense TaxID=1776730 RepID=A0A7C9VBF6_9HYPH|nr:hypothetical protein [Mesorhizobium zhangyense]
MIVRPRPGLLKLFFVMRGSIVPRIAPQIIGFGIYAALVVAGVKASGISFDGYNIAPFGLLGVTLSIYLGFRNNAAYDRWWEARKLWGQLVFDVRNFSRAVLALVPGETKEARPILMEVLAFCHLLRGHLRNVDASGEARGFIGDELDGVLTASNRPDEMVRRMGRRIAALKAEGRIEAMDCVSSTSDCRALQHFRPAASALPARRCPLPIRCCCSVRPISSVSCCRSGWRFRPAGARRCLPH